MPLYLAATPDRLTRARAVTPRLAHVAYRLGPGSELLAAPLPPKGKQERLEVRQLLYHVGYRRTVRNFP